jgi:SNF2 family DNA or RNA helicase
MINKKAVSKFLARKLENFDWIKKYKKLELLNELSYLEPVPQFGKIKPWAHQMALFLLCLVLKRFMINSDMGSGKTVIVLMILIYRKQCGEKPRAIVFVPYITSVLTWIEEVEDKCPTLKLVPLLGTSEQNLAALQGDGDLFVACYQSAVAMVTETVFNKKKNKNEWQLTAAQVRKYFDGFDTIILDEVHKASSASSLTYRMCRAISKECEWAFGLTGTPFGRDPIGLWPQYYLIDFGETLGPTLEFFKAVFYTEGRNYWGGYEFTFKKKLEPDLHRMVKNRSIYYAIDELHDMPQKIYVTKTLPPPPDSEGYCKAALQQINDAVKRGSLGPATKGVGGTGSSVYRIVESNYLKLRQLSSGFMTLKGEDNDKIQVKFDDNPKLEALADLIESMPADSKMIVFHHFVYTNELISERLKIMKVGHARIWGKQRDPIGQLRKFKADANCRVLVINDQSGSSSLNLQIANYLVFFEQPDSPINRQQAERRVWRPGQAKRVLIYDLLVKSTKDYALHASNKAGEDLLQSIIAGRTKL